MAKRKLKGKVLKLRYGITTTVSERGTAGVYYAWDEDEEVQVVVRVPHPDLLDDDEFVARFLDPAHVPTDIPGLVPVIEIGRQKDLPFAIVPCVEGKTVETLMTEAGGKLAAEDILPWVRTVGPTLGILHGRGVAHRSVSPRSILVAEDGTVSLTDVAVASALDEAPTSPEALDPTPFTAPEAASTSFGPAADQFSLAATMATAVMGTGFLARQARKGMDKVLVSRMPPAAVAALMKGLDPDPEARYSTVDGFVGAFTEAVEELPTSPPMGEGTATMLLTDVKDEVAAILQRAADEDDDEDAPLAEPIPVAEPVDDDEPVDAVAEPVDDSDVPPARKEPTEFRRKYLVVVAGVVAVLLVAGGWLLLGPKEDPNPPAEPPPKTDVPGVPPANIPEPPPADDPPPDPPPAEFTAKLTIDEEAIPDVTAAETVSVTGRLVDAKDGWVEVVGRRIDPDDSGRFRAVVKLVEGDNEIEFRFFDGKGRSGEPVEVDIERDSEAPSVTVTTPRAGFVTKEPVIVVTGRVMDAHPKEIRIGDKVFPVGEDRKFRAEVRLADEGPNRLEVRGIDEVGNESRPLPLTVVLDSAGPVIVISGPREGEVVGTGTVEVRGTVTDPHLDKVKVNGHEIDVGGTGEFSTEIDVDEGDAEIRIVARDTLGHETVTNRRIVRDATGPAMTISEPGDGTVVKAAKVTVRGRVQDPHPGPVTVNGREVKLDESGWFETDVELKDGRNVIRIVSRDSVGNEAEPVELVVTADRSGPALTLAELPPETDDERVTIRGSVGEDGCIVQVGGKDALVTGRDFRAEVALTVGANRIEVRATDRVGNESSKHVSITRRPPGPPADVPHLAAVGAKGRVNGAAPARVPMGLSPGDRVTGPATITTPTKDRIEVADGAVLQVRKPDRGVHVFFVVKGAVTGRITSATSVGVAFGWLVIPRGVRAEFKAATESTTEARVKITDGSGAVLSGAYSVILKQDQSIRIFSTRQGNFRFQVPTRNATEVTVRNEATAKLTISARVPPGYSGTIEQLGGGKRTRLTFETARMSGKMPFVWTSVGGKTVEKEYLFPDKFCVVDKIGDVGELSIKSK